MGGEECGSENLEECCGDQRRRVGGKIKEGFRKVVSWIMGTCYVDVISQLSGPFWNQGGGPVGLMGLFDSFETIQNARVVRT